jgi:hypothetical protein
MRLTSDDYSFVIEAKILADSAMTSISLLK